MMDLRDIHDVPNFTTKDYRPSGRTALYDAIVEGVHMADQRRTANDHVIYIIMTDGHDNLSRHTKADVERLIKDRQNGQTFIYIGHDPELWVREMGVRNEFAVRFDNPIVNFQTINNLLQDIRQMFIQMGANIIKNI